MKKKIFTLFLAICMICTILPFGAMAASDYGIVVGDVLVTSDNKGDVLGDGTVKYDPSTGKLTLNNANITKSIKTEINENGDVAFGSIIIAEDAGDVNIVLKGDNKISTVCSENGGTCMAIVSTQKLTVSGSGSLTVSAKGMSSKTPVACTGIVGFNIDIKGGTINITSGDAKGDGNISAGILCYNTFSISGGTLKATAGNSDVSVAVFVGGASSADSIDMEELTPGSFNMTGGKLTAAGKITGNDTSCGILFYGTDFNVSGGTLVAQGDMAIIAGEDTPVIYKCPSGCKVYAGDDSSAKAWDKETPFDYFKYVKIDFTKKTDDGNPFVDVKKGSYCYDPVLWAYKHSPQITAGMDATHFQPETGCTRAHIVTFLWRANGCPAPTTTKCPFKDVKKGSFYYDAVLWAVENGITTGVDKTHFKPNDTCTRGQAVTFLWRADGKPAPASTKCPFKDAKDKDAFYYDAMLWAVGKNITNGVDKTHFAPNNVCTRGQIVTFLYRDLA